MYFFIIISYRFLKIPLLMNKLKESQFVIYPRAIEILQLIGADGFIQLTSSMKDFQSPISDLLKKHFKGTNIDAEQRTKLFKLAWDIVGSSLGSRRIVRKVLCGRSNTEYSYPICKLR